MLQPMFLLSNELGTCTLISKLQHTSFVSSAQEYGVQRMCIKSFKVLKNTETQLKHYESQVTENHVSNYNQLFLNACAMAEIITDALSPLNFHFRLILDKL